MLNLLRDSQRNFSTAKNIIRQLDINILGTDYKLTFKDNGEEFRLAEKWFNEKFASHCYFNRRMALSEFQHLALQTILREGDMGLGFDRDILQTGRLMAYESDQICDAPRLPYKSWTQQDGVILNRYGQEVGYCTTNRHGCTIAPEDDYTIWRNHLDDDSRNTFSFLRTPWRFGQARGDGQLFACIGDILDVQEIRSKELQTAKSIATMAMKVTRKIDTPNMGMEQVFDPTLSEDEALASLNESKVGQYDDGSNLPNYQNMESLTGGNLVYLDEGDDIEMLDSANRPSLNLEEFSKRVTRDCVAGAGLAGCYADLTPSGSYFSFRGELLMTWANIKVWQQWVENNIQKWIAERAIQFAIETKQIPQLPEGWQFRIQFNHPSMPLIDVQKEAQAFMQLVRNGQTNLKEEMGSGYAETLKQLADEVADFQRLGLPHPMFQTVAGAEVQNVGKVADDDDSDTEASVEQ